MMSDITAMTAAPEDYQRPEWACVLNAARANLIDELAIIAALAIVQGEIQEWFDGGGTGQEPAPEFRDVETLVAGFVGGMQFMHSHRRVQLDSAPTPSEKLYGAARLRYELNGFCEWIRGNR